MKKNRKTALAAAMLTGAAVFTGCDHGGGLQTVYGPPPAEETTAVTEPVQCEYGAPVTEAVTTSARPSTVPAVYGPPPTDSFTTDVFTTDYDPSADDIQDVYGPPHGEGLSQGEGLSPYSPENDDVQIVYGPPQE